MEQQLNNMTHSTVYARERVFRTPSRMNQSTITAKIAHWISGDSNNASDLRYLGGIAVLTL